MFDQLFSYKNELRFIGENGSMGLERGRVYAVKMLTFRGYFWVIWTPHRPWPTSGEPPRSCPYGSVQAFANNWELP